MTAPASCVDLTQLARDKAEAPAPPRQAPAKPEHGGARYRVQFTADQAYLDLLEEARQLLAHMVPDRDLVEVQRRALQALVKALRARRVGVTKRSRPAQVSAPEQTTAPARHMPVNGTLPTSYASALPKARELCPRRPIRAGVAPSGRAVALRHPSGAAPALQPPT